MSTPAITPTHILLCLILLLSLGLRLPFHHITFFSVDEAVSAVVGSSILEGGLPYKDAIDHRGPLTYYAYAGIFALTGSGDMAGVHTIYIWLYLGLSLGIWWIGKTSFSEKVGVWAALLFTVFSWANPFHEMWAAHTEWLLTAASLVGMGVWLNARGRWHRCLLAGMLFGLCTLSKQVGALEVGAVLGYLVLRGWGANKDKRVGFTKEAGFLLLGWGVPMALTAWGFWWSGAWEDWVFYLWTYNTAYYMPEIEGIRRGMNTLKLFGAFFLHKWMLLGVIAWTIYHRISKVGRHPRELWLICWVGAAFLEAMAGGRAFLHYLIPALIPLCLLGAVGIVHLLQRQKQKRWLKPMLIIGLVWPILVTGYHHSFMFHTDTSITEFEAIVEEIRSTTTEADQIFVWGFAPEIYVLSGRSPASRFSFCNVLTGHIPAGNESKEDTRYAIVPGSWDILMQELAHHPPTYIIDTQVADYRAYGKYPIGQYPLATLLEAEYELAQEFHQQHPEVIFDVYQRRKP
ncbi:MAG: glycosyltransferase family 39 protein [Bacteroidota bacterium]